MKLTKKNIDDYLYESYESLVVYLKNELTRNQKSTDSRQQEVEEQLSESQQILDQLKKQGHDLVLKRKKLNEEISVLNQKIAQKSKLKDQNEQNYFQVIIFNKFPLK